MQRKRLIDIRFLDGRNHGLGAWSQVFKGSAAGPNEASTNYVSALDALVPEYPCLELLPRLGRRASGRELDQRTPLRYADIKPRASSCLLCAARG